MPRSEEDLEAVRYSQHAAAFLMTLLPNVEKLALPRRWKPLGATNKLIDVIVRMANQSHLLKTGLASPRLPDLGHLFHWSPRIDLI